MPPTRWAVLSVAVACATGGLKFLAYWVTGSVGALSDALESLVNVVAALALLAALRFAAAPPDETHAYGHEKVEYFSSGFEGALILFAAGQIVYTAVPRLLNPAPVAQLGPGIGLLLLAAAINLVAGQLLLRAGRRARSLALEADGRHLMADVYTSVAVVVALALVPATGIERLDPLVGIAVALHILSTGAGLLRRSFHGLMDRALEPAELERVRRAIAGQLAGGMTFHELRTRRAGPRHLADVHLLVPGEYTVRQGHALATAVEQAVRDAVPGTEITVHVEPLEGYRGAGHQPAEDVARGR